MSPIKYLWNLVEFMVYFIINTVLGIYQHANNDM